MSLLKSLGKRIVIFIQQLDSNLLLLIIPVIIYLPGILGWIPYPLGENTYTDLILTHYPYSQLLKQSLLQDHAIPLWSNLIYSGSPFAANPLSGFWYFPGWFALLFPLPAGISVSLGLHVIFGSLGFYLLMRREGVEKSAALLGGIAFGMMPKLSIHYGAGHVSLIYAISWTPWLFLISVQDRSGWRTGLTAAMLFLADPRWAALTGLLWLTYIIAHRQYRKHKSLRYFFEAAIIAILIAMPLILPLLEFVNLSTRAMLTLDERLKYSISLEKLIGLIIPRSGGNIEWFLYIGGLPVLIFVFQLLIPKFRKANLFWSVWILVSIMFAMGSNLVGMENIIGLPVYRLLRIPARAIYIMSISFLVIMTKTLDWIKSNAIYHKQIRLVSFGFLVLSILFSLGILQAQAGLWLSAVWGLIVLSICSIIIFGMTMTIETEKWLWVLMLIIIVDYSVTGYINTRYKREQTIFSEAMSISKIISEDKDIFRLYSPSYSMPQHIAILNEFELADGVDPLQILAYRDFMEKATGVEVEGYSVTIPPIKTGSPLIDNMGAQPDQSQLGLLNVKYIVSAYEIDAEGLDLIGEFSDGFMYRNRYYLPRAWIQQNDAFTNEPPKIASIKQVKINYKKPNMISMLASGPGRLVLSEVAYPGWRAKINGVKVNISSAFDILQAVDVPPGEHVVEFRFLPQKVFYGMIFGLIGWGYCIYQSKKQDGIGLFER